MHYRSFLLTSLLLIDHACLAQSAPIKMDGLFEDWTADLATFTDNNAPAAGIDLLSMQVTNDEAYLYIRLNVGTEIDLQDDLVPHGIALYIDADNNASTGTSPQSNYGAELRVRFDTRACNQYIPTSTVVSWSSLDLVPLPTTTSTSFEVAIARNAVPDGVHPLFTSPTIRILFRELDNLDAMPNTASPAFTYTFDETPVAPVVPIDIPKTSATDVRVLAWNVLADGITNAALQGQFQRMLTALAPDVIGYSECVSSTAAQVKTRMDSWLPVGGNGWYVVKDDFDMIIASRWPIAQSWSTLTRQYAALIDLPSTYATDLLFTAAHLHCCTADGSRQNEADEYVRFVQDAMTAGGTFTLPANTPMIHAGDLNSVGHAQQLATLLSGDVVNNATYGPDGPMDWDGSTAARVEALHTNTRMGYTWRSNTSAYPSGRLDHMLYTDAVATLVKGFILRTESMPPPTLTALGLLGNDASTASDHLPLVGDFALPTAAVKVHARCFLEGPFVANALLMHDSLRALGAIPTQEPYTILGHVLGNAGATIGTGVLAMSGSNAIVDWVLVELRDANDPSARIATQCALLQRDGDVVDLDGSSPVSFAVAFGSYHVAVRHRNHFGVMSAGALALSNAAANVDFTLPTTAVFGTGATKNIAGSMVMWAGNVLADDTLRYVGAGNDRDPILVRIGGTTPTNTASGYFVEDVNMDGTVKYVGASNDRDTILVNIGGSTPTNTLAEQVP